MRIKTLIVVAALLAPGAAMAHAKLVTANPAPDSVVKTAPARLQLTFSETVTPGLATIEVTDPSGAKLHVMPASADPKAPETLTAVVHGGGKPGVYKVDWAAAGSDAHRGTGSYGFTVKP